jgi:carboxyl-terminal processing protease
MRRLFMVAAGLIMLFVLTGAAFGAGMVAAGANLLTPCIVRTSDQPAQFATFWQAWNLVQRNFVDRQALDPTAMTYGAVRGMVEALGDTGHTAFLTPQEKELRRSGVAGAFTGIGAELGVREGLPVIVAPIDGSPAAEAGLQPGDILVRVDGEDVTRLPLSEIVEKVRGPAGTEVQLTVLRTDDNQSYDITITRREIDIPAASWAMVPGTSVAAVRISQFSANAERDLINAIQAAEADGATGLIVDVRNNPGGLLDQAIRVTSQFLTGGNVLLEEDAEGNRTEYPVVEGGRAPEISLVVLVNPGTASAAEIFAGAIQDHERGQVVGETTFGTGTVLQPFDLDDGSELLLGVRQWLTPNGRLIRNQGIAPDVEVTLPLGSELLSPAAFQQLTAGEVQASADAQMQRALALLTSEDVAE